MGFFVKGVEGKDQIGRKGRKRAVFCRRPRHKHVGQAHIAIQREHRTGDLPQAALNAIAHHRIAEFFGHRVSHMNRSVHGRGRSSKQQPARHTKRQTRRTHTQKVAAATQSNNRQGWGGKLRHHGIKRPKPHTQALRRLRPRARRAAITLRPPTVALRVRKP